MSEPSSRMESILQGTYTGNPLSRIEALLMEGGGVIPGGETIAGRNVDISGDSVIRMDNVNIQGKDYGDVESAIQALSDAQKVTYEDGTKTIIFG